MWEKLRHFLIGDCLWKKEPVRIYYKDTNYVSTIYYNNRYYIDIVLYIYTRNTQVPTRLISISIIYIYIYALLSYLKQLGKATCK